VTDLNESLIDLQTRVTFQEDTLVELNRRVAQQDQEIRQLKEQTLLLAKRLDDFIYAQEQSGIKPADERPPHY